ncbi:MAG: F0F1 ATP synthase subunit alpha [Clostridia bacterium]|nr:F0F1 ATP synthase subunit alpha [Clostridia bacterium]NCC74813.1 F0F1 ATP synthase subunit alpha [Clostridia bacterium]
MTHQDLATLSDSLFQAFTTAVANHSHPFSPVAVGRIQSIAAGVVRVTGLDDIGFEELVQFADGSLGMAYDLDIADLGVILFGHPASLAIGEPVRRLGRVLDIPVGHELLGRVIDPLGRPLDGAGPIKTRRRLPIERPAPAIMDRLPVTVPLQTGIKAIDAMVPIGRGQRELIMGDRKTGKTTVALDTIISQRDSAVYCVYCAIGQRSSAVAKAVDVLRKNDALAHCVVVVAESNEAAGLSYIAPYAATSIAESFMAEGYDTLVVYDDLTSHARSYRELSLLLHRPPGREAFPGDIFYIHSRLLERSTRLKQELGGGSLTALPIVETESQNISAYIPTNLISITDGQIYLSPALFELGVLPAIDVGLSVSRVGGKAQHDVYRTIVKDLKLAYAQFVELESFARFGAHLDESSRRMLAHGQKIRSCLKQSEQKPLRMEAQILIMAALAEGLLDAVPIEQMALVQDKLAETALEHQADVAAWLSESQLAKEPLPPALVRLAETAVAPFARGKEQV